MGNQGKGKGAWKGSVKNAQKRAQSAQRATPKPSKGFNSNKNHHDTLKGNR